MVEYVVEQRRRHKETDAVETRPAVSPVTGHWSEGSLVRMVTGPKGHWSEWSLVRRGTGPKGHWSKGYGVGIHCREVVRIEAQQSKHFSLCKPNHNPSLSCEPKSWEANEADTVLHYVLRLVQAPVRLSRVAAENSNPRLTNWYSLSHKRPI